MSRKKLLKEQQKVRQDGDFPGGPVVKTLPSNAGIAGLTPGQGARIPHASLPKSQSIKETKL